MVDLKNWPAACIQRVFSVGSSARVGGTEDAQPSEAGGAGQGQPDRAHRPRSTGLRAPEGNDAALPRRLAARARCARRAAQLASGVLGGETYPEAAGAEDALVGEDPDVSAQLRRKVRLEDRLDVLPQPARREDQPSAARAARRDQLGEPWPQPRLPSREGAHFVLAREHLGIDGLDDPARAQLAAAEPRAFRLPVRGTAEVLADLVADVEERGGAVEVADDGDRG